MATIVEFPGSDARQEMEFRKLLDAIPYPSERVRQCVIDNVAPLLMRHGKLPDHSFSLEIPAEISKAEVMKIKNRIEEESKAYVWKVQQPMLVEMIHL